MRSAPHLRTAATGRPAARRAAAAAAVVLGLGGLAACGDATTGGDAVGSEDLENLEADLGTLDERLGDLEQDVRDQLGDVAGDARDAAESAAADLGALGDIESLLDQEVTFSAEVSELLGSAGDGSAFTVDGPTGEPITVVVPEALQDLQAGDRVEVSGTVEQIARDTFQQDFGVAADDVVPDVEAFFQETQDRFGIDASSVDVLQDATGGN